ncbi:MAG TPA: PEGA domain-containing protein [Polyangiaceae bacterium]|jgi:hypothetical protein
MRFHWGAIALLCFSTRAFAGGDDAAALKARADAAMDAHHYDEAIAGYTAAYERSPSPPLLYNRGRAYEAHGDYALAYDDVERFKETASPEVRAKVPKLDELLGSLKARFSTFQLSCNVAGAHVIVGGREIGVTPLAPVRLTAGRTTLEIIADGEAPYKKEIDLQGGTTTELDAALVARTTFGILTITTAPPGAAITVDKTPLGLSPTEGTFPAGTHAILAHVDGYDDAQSQAVVAIGERRVIDLALHKHPTVFTSPLFWTVVGTILAGTALGFSIAAFSERGPDAGIGFSPGHVSGP